MKGFDSFFDKYQRLVLFDTETTGLSFSRDEIIQFSAVVLERRNGNVEQVQQYDHLITLSPGGYVPPKIQELTGITEMDILERGISKEQLCQDIAQMVEGDTLLLAYNAHFDLSFLYYLLLRHGDPSILKGKDKLDLLTVYRDRRSAPHRLTNAISAYGLSGKVVNSHSAIDDVIATVAVMEEMLRERDDLLNYVNLFGYLPQFGVDGKKIGSVNYKPQPYEAKLPLYEL
jgi:DNA polymerase-3 subunit epsilon